MKSLNSFIHFKFCFWFLFYTCVIVFVFQINNLLQSILSSAGHRFHCGCHGWLSVTSHIPRPLTELILQPQHSQQPVTAS